MNAWTISRVDRKRGSRPASQARSRPAAFWRWFRNSKVVDAHGEPMVVYHGTASPSWTLENTRNHFESWNGMGHGAYFTADIAGAEEYARMDGEVGDGYPALIPVFLSIQSPKIIEGLDSQSITDEHKAQYVAEGHDGVFGVGEDGEIYEIAAFYPWQIKSAIGNCGAYDPAKEDIRA